MSFVTAYRRRDGRRVTVPAHWLDHPKLGKPYQKTAPRRPAGESKTTAPVVETAPAAGDAEKE